MQWSCPRGEVEAESTRFFFLGNSPCSDNDVAVCSRIAAPICRTGSLCLVLDKLDGVAGVVAHERERSARGVVELKDYFHTLGLQ